ncbi:hypothetical protein DYI23_12975 [Roseibium polysiphoniae]|uniref:Uncharacterized protein n=1 Tax=Roseibium polysiphoniae TaxID=2571221 RepID=A0A944CD04_9HYPH|nr:hypothetical protein [Roseibium polysiphoniae]MBS8261131.1 hypothetical protein [Roseibium polysiphoniae]
MTADKSGNGDTANPGAEASEGAGKTAPKKPRETKEDRLAQALRANLRRRKSAAKARKSDDSAEE